MFLLGIAAVPDGLKPLLDGALGKAPFELESDRPQLARPSSLADRLGVDVQELGELARGEVLLDQGTSNARTETERGTLIWRESRRFPSLCFTIWRASSFGVSNSGQSSRNSFWAR